MPWAAAGAVVAAGISYAASESASDKAAAASDRASAGANLQAQIAAEQWDKYQELYEPLEKQMVQQAQDYTSPENYQRAAGDASATVAAQYGKARERLNRTPGLDPSSAGYAANLSGLELSQAAADATQQNLARKQVTDTGYSRQMAALGLGKGLDSTAAQGAASSAQTLNAIAASQNNLAGQQSNAAGQFVGNLFNGLSKVNWGGSSAGLDSVTPTYGTPSGYQAQVDSQNAAGFNW